MIIRLYQFNPRYTPRLLALISIAQYNSKFMKEIMKCVYYLERVSIDSNVKNKSLAQLIIRDSIQRLLPNSNTTGYNIGEHCEQLLATFNIY